MPVSRFRDFAISRADELKPIDFNTSYFPFNRMRFSLRVDDGNIWTMHMKDIEVLRTIQHFFTSAGIENPSHHFAQKQLP